MANTSTVFSEFELRKMGIKVSGSTAFKSADCVGSSEETLNTKVITKMCRGVVKKKRVKGDGTGSLKISMHMPYDIFTEIYGMNLDTLIEGVKAYGVNSIHKEFAIVQDVFDEDGIEKFKAYPNCVVETGIARKIENGAEVVAEIELEVSLSPDDYGNCEYEALADGLQENVKTKWLSEFEPSLVRIAEV